MKRASLIDFFCIGLFLAFAPSQLCAELAYTTVSRGAYVSGQRVNNPGGTFPVSYYDGSTTTALGQFNEQAQVNSPPAFFSGMSSLQSLISPTRIEFDCNVSGSIYFSPASTTNADVGASLIANFSVSSPEQWQFNWEGQGSGNLRGSGVTLEYYPDGTGDSRTTLISQHSNQQLSTYQQSLVLQPGVYSLSSLTGMGGMSSVGLILEGQGSQRYSFVQVPEPSSTSMLLAAVPLAYLAFRRRR
jgi:hypothetical protein